MAVPAALRQAATDRPFKWLVTLMCKLPDGSIARTEIETKNAVILRELDDAVREYREMLLLENPGHVDDGFRARIL